MIGKLAYMFVVGEEWTPETMNEQVKAHYGNITSMVQRKEQDITKGTGVLALFSVIFLGMVVGLGFVMLALYEALGWKAVFFPLGITAFFGYWKYLSWSVRRELHRVAAVAAMMKE